MKKAECRQTTNLQDAASDLLEHGCCVYRGCYVRGKAKTKAEAERKVRAGVPMFELYGKAPR